MTKGHTARNVVIMVVILVLAGLGAWYFIGTHDSEQGAARDASAYIEAVLNKDFETVFRLNAVAQKRKAIITQRAQEKERGLKELKEEFKTSFDSFVPEGDLRAQWAEKGIFVPGTYYRITNVEKVLDTENPSQPASERMNAIILADFEYKDKVTAPDLGGKVKSAEVKIKMIQAKNVSRILKEEPARGWLFHSVQINRESMKYWE